jgi:hypothetical protein
MKSDAARHSGSLEGYGMQLRWSLLMMALVTMCSSAMAADPHMSDMMKKSAYARALRTLFDRAGNLPSWTQEALKPKGSYVTGSVTYDSIGGTTYEVFSNCESQNCNRSQLTVMFAPNGAQAWGALF